MNYWIASKTTGSYCLKNRQTYSMLHHLYIMCSKCLPPAQTQAHRCWRQVANRTFNEQLDSDRSLVLDASSQFVDIWDLDTRWRRTFRACTVLKCAVEVYSTIQLASDCDGSRSMDESVASLRSSDWRPRLYLLRQMKSWSRLKSASRIRPSRRIWHTDVSLD